MTNRNTQTPWQEQAQNRSWMAIGGFGEGFGTGFNIGGPVGRQMGIRPTMGQYSDPQLEHIVSSVLDNDPVTANADINVSVQNAVVTLSGTVRHRITKLRAEDDAWSVPTVQDVQNNVQVKPRRHQHPATPASGQTGATSASGKGQTQAVSQTQQGPAQMSDEQVRNHIYDALDSNPNIPDNAHIDVHVNGGTVTLQGEVPSKNVKHLAGELAWQMAAVTDVYNQLQIMRRGSHQGQVQPGLAVERRKASNPS